MKKHILVLVFLMIFISAGLAYGAEAELTLSEAKELALKNSIDIQQAELNVDKADKARRDADEVYNKAVANYFYDSQKESITALREAYRAALNNYADTKKMFENKKIQLNYDIEKLYFNILNTEDEIELLKNELEIQADQLRIRRLMLELGMSTRNDLDQLILAYNGAENNLQMKRDVLQNYKWTMNRYIGREPDTSLKLNQAVVKVDYSLQGVSAAYEQAVDSSLVIDQLERTIGEKEKDKDWYGYNLSDKIEGLELTIREVKLNKDMTEYSLKVGVKNMYNNINLAWELLMNSKNSLDLAKKTYDIDTRKHELGMISEFELKNSKKVYNQAAYSYKKAGFDYYLAVRVLELAEQGIVLSQ